MIKKLSKFVSIRGFGALPAPYSIMFVALCSVASVQAHAENSLKLGFGAGIGPKYSGSDKNVGKMAIGVDYQMDNGFFASTMRGLGYGASHGEFSYSVGLGYRGGRTDSSKNGFNMQSGSDYLRGMGDIKGSATALLSVAYTPIKWLSFDAMAELALSQRINGNRDHLGATGTLSTKPRRIVVRWLGRRISATKNLPVPTMALPTSNRPILALLPTKRRQDCMPSRPT